MFIRLILRLWAISALRLCLETHHSSKIAALSRDGLSRNPQSRAEPEFGTEPKSHGYANPKYSLDAAELQSNDAAASGSNDAAPPKSIDTAEPKSNEAAQPKSNDAAEPESIHGAESDFRTARNRGLCQLLRRTELCEIKTSRIARRQREAATKDVVST